MNPRHMLVSFVTGLAVGAGPTVALLLADRRRRMRAANSMLAQAITTKTRPCADPLVRMPQEWNEPVYSPFHDYPLRASDA